MARKFQRILGINFFVGDMPDLLGLCAEGNFIVVPAAPALVDLPTNAAYRESVEKSDFAITDSAFMVILWRLFTGQSVPRISGPKTVARPAGQRRPEKGGQLRLDHALASRDGSEPRVA